jgi:phage terminase small subunit
MATTARKSATKDRQLNPKQEMFCREYLVDLNATQAAIRAGYAPKSAFVHASRMLNNTKVTDLIQSLMNKRSKVVDLTAADVLRDINLVKADAMRQIPDREGNEAMINHAAALKALELQGKHLKMFTEKLEHTGPDGGPIKHTVEIFLHKA